MRLGLLLLVMTATASAAPRKTVVVVKQWPAPRCGGAKPPPPPPGPVPKPKAQPLPGATFVIRKGTKNRGKVVSEVTTDDRGAFTASLAPGTYCVVTSAKRDLEQKPGASIDPLCFASWIKTCDAVITAPTTKGAFSLQGSCMAPCYRGPPPP